MNNKDTKELIREIEKIKNSAKKKGENISRLSSLKFYYKAEGRKWAIRCKYRKDPNQSGYHKTLFKLVRADSGGSVDKDDIESLIEKMNNGFSFIVRDLIHDIKEDRKTCFKSINKLTSDA